MATPLRAQTVVPDEQRCRACRLGPLLAKVRVTPISNITCRARGSRNVHAESLLKAVTGAEAALVVTNNAAATPLMLTGRAYGREVPISRGEGARNSRNGSEFRVYSDSMRIYRMDRA